MENSEEYNENVKEPLTEVLNMEADGKSTKKIDFIKFKIIKTIVMFLCWTALGLYSEILGPSLPQLKGIVHANSEEIGRTLAGRSAGLFIGSFVGGILSDEWWQRRDLLAFVFLGSAGLMTAVAPMCTTLSGMGVVLFLHGVCHGGLTTAANPILNSLWSEKSAGPFSFMHSGYGVGGSIAPVILNAFNSNSSSNIFAISNSSTKSKLNSTLSSNNNIDPTFIRYPFLIIGVYCISISFLFVIYSCIRNPMNPSIQPLCQKKHSNNNATVKENKNMGESIVRKLLEIFDFEKLKDRERVAVMAIAFFGFFGIVGNERIFGKFQFSYATEGKLHMDISHGYMITGLYWACFTMGRIITAFLSAVVSPRKLLIVEIIGALTASLIMVIWPKSHTMFYVGSSIFGLFKSPLFPTMLGVLSLMGPVTGGMVMIVNFGSSTGALVCQYLMGFLIENYGYFTFPITVTATSVFLLIIFIILLYMSRKKQIIVID